MTHPEMLRVDPNPPDRSLRMSLADLSSCRAWLREAHAARLLPSEPSLFGHWYLYFGLDPIPEEIGESLREYLERRP